MTSKIIELLIEYELAVSELYRECAEKFEEHRDFWSELADEEIIHADNIRKLTDEAIAKNAIIDEKAFAVRPVEISIEYSKEITKRVRDNKIDLLSVLSLAYDLESSLIESEYHKVFVGREEKVNELIRQIHLESTGHKERVRVLKEKILEEKKNKTLERWD